MFTWSDRGSLKIPSHEKNTPYYAETIRNKRGTTPLIQQCHWWDWMSQPGNGGLLNGGGTRGDGFFQL